MTRPVLLDLYCCAGGAAEGYHRAGFDVFGVDIDPQPRYPFDFYQADAIDFLDRLIESESWVLYDAIHASPPCQAHSDLQKQNKRDYPDFIAATRERLVKIGLPYIIENVDGAPLIDPVKLCGAGIAQDIPGVQYAAPGVRQFPELRVIRHRLFESNVPLVGTPCPPKHPLVFTHDKRKPHYGRLDQMTDFVQVTGGGNCSVAAAKDAMGIDWMIKRELNEALPPAYTEYLGRQLIDFLSIENCPPGGKMETSLS